MFVAVSVISQQPATPNGETPMTRHAFTQRVQSLEQRVIRPGDESAIELSLRRHPWLGLQGWNCVCFRSSSRA